MRVPTFLKVASAADLHRNGELLEQEVHRLRSQIETLRRTHQAEIETHLEERAQLVEEITRLKQAVPA